MRALLLVLVALSTHVSALAQPAPRLGFKGIYIGMSAAALDSLIDHSPWMYQDSATRLSAISDTSIQVEIEGLETRVRDGRWIEYDMRSSTIEADSMSSVACEETDYTWCARLNYFDVSIWGGRVCRIVLAGYSVPIEHQNSAAAWARVVGAALATGIGKAQRTGDPDKRGKVYSSGDESRTIAEWKFKKPTVQTAEIYLYISEYRGDVQVTPWLTFEDVAAEKKRVTAEIRKLEQREEQKAPRIKSGF